MQGEAGRFGRIREIFKKGKCRVLPGGGAYLDVSEVNGRGGKRSGPTQLDWVSVTL